jgi:hypothetical protein
MRAGDVAASTRLGPTVVTGVASTGDTLEVLQGAAHAGSNVCIGYVNSHGVASKRIVRPVSVDGGILEGFDHSAGTADTGRADTRAGTLWRFPLHRIISAAVLPD